CNSAVGCVGGSSGASASKSNGSAANTVRRAPYLHQNNHAYDFDSSNMAMSDSQDEDNASFNSEAAAAAAAAIEAERSNRSAGFVHRLGFVPQRKLTYQLMLPFRDQVENEALTQLSELRIHLPRAVALGDVHCGASYWVAKLDRYIRLYGEFFSKADHVAFTQLVYQLATWKGLEPRLIEKFSTVFKTLTKKRKLLSKQDLTLDWKPLYEVIKFYVYGKEKAHGLLQTSNSFVSTLLHDLASHSRRFFPLSAVSEIWEEFRWRLCPVSEKFNDALFFLNYLMPVSFNQAELPSALAVWLDEFLDLWHRHRRHETLEQEGMHILARIAQRARGFIDWEPHLDHLFTSLLRRMDLPVGQVAYSASFSKFDINMACCVLIYAVKDGSSVIDRLDQLFQSVGNFFHPSNAGEWTSDLCTVLCGLANYLHIRVYCERVLKPCEDDAPIPVACRIKDCHIDALVSMILPRAMTAVFNKTSNIEMGRILTSLRSLAFLRPNVVVPRILDTVFPSLETLLEPHRLHDSLSCLAVTLLPLVQRSSQYSAGQRHVIPLLRALLPAIDYNDSRKSNSALSIIAHLCNMIIVADCSGMIDSYPDLTAEEREVLLQTDQLEDFALDLMDRMFSVIQAMYAYMQDHLHPSAAPDVDKEEVSWTDSMQTALENLIRNSSPEIQRRMLDKMYDFVSNNTMDWKSSGEVASSLVYCFCRIIPETTCDLFLPHFMRLLHQRVREGEEFFTDDFLDSTFLWHLQIVTSVLNGGLGLLKYRAEITEIISTLARVQCKHALKIGRQLLDNVLTSLTATLMNCRPFSESPLFADSADTPPTRLWGRVIKLASYKVTDADFNLPTKESVAFAQDLIDGVVRGVAQKLSDMCDGRLELGQDHRAAYIGWLKSAVQGVEHVNPMWQDELVPLLPVAEISAPTEVSKFVYRLDSFEITWSGKNLRCELRKLAIRLFHHLTEKCEDDTQSLEELILLFNSLLFPFLDYSAIKKVLTKWINNIVIFCRNSLLGKEYHLPVYHFLRVCVCHCTRLMSNSRRMDSSALEIGWLLYRTAVQSPYERVRSVARNYLLEFFYRFRQSPQLFLPKACQQLEAGGGEMKRHEFEGLLEVLREFYPDFGSTVYSVVPLVGQALVQAKLSPFLLEGNVDKKVDELELCVLESLNTLNIARPATPDALRSLAERLLAEQGAKAAPTESERLSAESLLAEDFSNRWKLFHSSTDWLLDAAGRNESSWQIVRLIMDLMPGQYDVPIPVSTVRFILHYMKSSVPSIRSNACHLLDAVMYSKRFVARRICLTPHPANPAECRVPGPRPDNDFLVFSSQRDAYLDQTTWEKFPRVDKETMGFTYWPPVVRIRDPADYLPADRQLDECGQLVRQFFTAGDTWQFLLTSCMTSLYEKDKQSDTLDGLDDLEDMDKFPTENMVSLLAKIYGPNVFTDAKSGECFIDSIRQLLEGCSGHDKEDVIHKSAAAVVGGLLRGSKSWGLKDYQQMWQWVLQLLEAAVATVSESSLTYWVEALAYLWNDCTLSPYRLTPLFEFLRKHLTNGSAFKECVRLKMLCICLLSLHWRGIELQQQILPYVLDNLARHDTRLRSTAASVLSAFLSDMDYQTQGFNVARLPFTASAIIADMLVPKLTQSRDILMSMCADNGGPSALTPVRSAHDLQAARAQSAMHQTAASTRLSGATIRVAARRSLVAATGLEPVSLPLPGHPGQVVASEDGSVAVAGAASSSSASVRIVDDRSGETEEDDLEDVEMSQQSSSAASPDATETQQRKSDAVFTIRSICTAVNQAGYSASTQPNESIWLLLPPMLELLQISSFDLMLDKDLQAALDMFAVLPVTSEVAPQLVDRFEQLSTSLISWKSRECLLRLLQCCVFFNLFVMAAGDLPSRVRRLVLRLLQDDSLDVRKAASGTLSGLLRCGYLRLTDDGAQLLPDLQRLCRTRLRKRQPGGSGPELGQVNARHSGVLGLCSIVESAPYDVPAHLPPVLMQLCQHVNDPEPIKSSVRSTLASFKRTHQETWHADKDMFTEEQLLVLTDLLVSPNYYA
ncbi:hypothetical protein BOX15_Mlig005545g5, partial [Macrostomum lignano]